ncbi:hypothetical protein AB2T85_17795 [Clostridium butyricum]|uniref:hypothetical protein n=1 Tax=Clostridium butyricum TaxID=1492 RepID=UPI003467D380
MIEMKITVIAMNTEIINEIYKFNNPKVKKIYAQEVRENEIEVTLIVDVSGKEEIEILKELNLFLRQSSDYNNYGYGSMGVIPAEFKRITSYDEANMMFASDIPIENKRVFMEILNCRNIGSMYYESELIDVVELILTANYEKILIQSVPVSLDDSLVEQLDEIDITVTGNKCSELIGKRFIGRVQSILKDNERRYVVTDVEPLPEDYCIGGLIFEMDTI